MIDRIAPPDTAALAVAEPADILSGLPSALRLVFLLRGTELTAWEVHPDRVSGELVIELEPSVVLRPAEPAETPAPRGIGEKSTC